MTSVFYVNLWQEFMNHEPPEIMCPEPCSHFSSGSTLTLCQQGCGQQRLRWVDGCRPSFLRCPWLLGQQGQLHFFLRVTRDGAKSSQPRAPQVLITQTPERCLEL